MEFSKKYTPGQALQKLKQYCAYQERCHTEVLEKLRDYGVGNNDAGEIIATLIEENYLNEERFAKQYAGGKFRMKQWGRTKIIHQLKMKGISQACIKAGLKEIEEDDYLSTLNLLLEKKWASLPGNNLRLKKKKCFDYLKLKGYETNLILEALKEL